MASNDLSCAKYLSQHSMVLKELQRAEAMDLTAKSDVQPSLLDGQCGAEDHLYDAMCWIAAWLYDHMV